MTTSEQESTFSETSSDPPLMCIPKAVAAQAAGRPDAVAVAMGSLSLTYHELDCQANRMARYLRARGAGADVPIGLCLPRSIEMVIAALGIMKAGAAYVPMDPSYPADRLAFMLEDAGAHLVVTDSAAQRLPQTACEVLEMSAPELSAGPDHMPRIDILPTDLAYLIYTSGSTGRPKGVEITHANLASLVCWHRDAFSVTASDRASHVAGLGFDAAVWELWPYLAAGASVHLADEIARNSPELLRDWLVSEQITVSFVPTPLAERMLALEWPAETSLRFLLTGGDALHHYPSADLPFQLINNYGPTECTVVATSGPVLPAVHSDSMPPIGTAIARTHVYLLDERFEEAPEGVTGEIFIGGAGVARGYHNRPDLTGERFIPNPFGSGRLYRTGDLARRLPTGEIAFVGRADDQIKIRGYRIEPQEIVHALNRHPEIQDSLVVARASSTSDRDGEKRLVAYLVTASNCTRSHTEVRDALRAHLPEYMLPSAFVRVEAFPTTQNGKIDVAQLPAPSPANTLADSAFELPATPTEQRIGAIIGSLLGLKNIGRNENFFLLGGHSLLAAQLIARLRDAFGVQIPLRTLFASPTIQMLASCIDPSSKTPVPAREEIHSCMATEACVVTNP